MATVGIDIEQFVTDPYGSGIQRVLQQLALHWPQQRLAADFIVPWRDGHLLLSPDQAMGLISLAFVKTPDGDRHAAVRAEVARLAESSPVVSTGQLLSAYSSWLLPEVSYLPSVLRRFELFQAAMPTVMIGYDTLPMTEPANYRFTPGTAANVSEYFRLLAGAGSVVCISNFTRDRIWDRLRRPRTLPISVAHPGGDHIEWDPDTEDQSNAEQSSRPVRFLRLGTMEDRKKPREILRAFREARRNGLDAELTFVGRPSASEQAINAEVLTAATENIGVRWIQDASDEEVISFILKSDIFLSVGTEGFGIPVLESIILGTPVAFSGIQPAAEVMLGFGASRLSSDDSELISAGALLNFGAEGTLREMIKSIDRERIPSWREFAISVAQAATS